MTTELKPMPFINLSERKPLTCNPADTKYEVLYKGKPIAKPNYATWDKDEQKFCYGWEGHLDKNPKHIEWRLYQEDTRTPRPTNRGRNEINGR